MEQLLTIETLAMLCMRTLLQAKKPMAQREAELAGAGQAAVTA